MTIEEEIELNKALNIGQLFINFPVMIVMFGLSGLSYYLYKIVFISKSVMIAGFVISFILGWLVWSFAIPKWRIWAFEKTDIKFHRKLKDEAIKAKLIWPDGHFFEKTEIRSQYHKERINDINKKIDEFENEKHTQKKPKLH